MRPVFVQIQCSPGKTYDVADTLFEREIVSELYSTRAATTCCSRSTSTTASISASSSTTMSRTCRDIPDADDNDVQGFLS